MRKKNIKRGYGRRGRSPSYETFLIPISLEETPYEAYLLIRRKKSVKPIYGLSEDQFILRDCVEKLERIEERIDGIEKFLTIAPNTKSTEDPLDPPEEKSGYKTILDLIDKRIDERIAEYERKIEKRLEEFENRVNETIKNAFDALEKRLEEKLNLFLGKSAGEEVKEESPKIQERTFVQEDLEKIALEYEIGDIVIENDKDFEPYLAKAMKAVEDAKNGKIDIAKLLEYERKKYSDDEEKIMIYMPLLIAAIKTGVEVSEKELEEYNLFVNNVGTLSEYEGFKKYCKKLYEYIIE